MRIFLILSLLAFATQAMSSHSNSGFIYLEHESGNTYSILLHTFETNINAENRVYECMVQAQSGGTIDTIQLHFDTLRTNQRMDSLFNEQYIYSTTYTFSNFGSYSIHSGQAIFLASVDNVNESTGWVETIFTFDSTFSNSPQLYLPINNILTRDTVNELSLLSTDADGDSLSYHLDVAKTNFGLLADQYSPAPTANGTSIHLDDVLGRLFWHTSNATGIYTVPIRIEEYRHGVKIGEMYSTLIFNVGPMFGFEAILQNNTNISVGPNKIKNLHAEVGKWFIDTLVFESNKPIDLYINSAFLPTNNPPQLNKIKLSQSNQVLVEIRWKPDSSQLSKAFPMVFRVYDNQVTQDVHILCSAELQTIGVIEAPLNQISAYPNPTTGLFWLELPSKNSVINVYNSTGQLIHSQKAASQRVQIKLNLSLPKGIYFVRVEDEYTKFIEKVILY